MGATEDADDNFDALKMVHADEIIVYADEIPELNKRIETLTEQLEQATEALRYTAYYGSSVPLGMPAEDYYHGAMNDLISHAARALPTPPEQVKP